LTAPDWLVQRIVAANRLSVCEALHMPLVGEKQLCITSPENRNQLMPAA
jgi:hypothetical protein